MLSQNEKPLTKQEFDDWATATKGTLNSIDEALGEHTHQLTAIKKTLVSVDVRLGTIEKKLEPLETIATELKAIRENTTAMLALYRRLDHRDYVFADKLKLDLRKVDAEA